MIYTSAVADSSEPSLLVVFGVASISAVAAIIAAIIAGWSARRAKRAELEADRVRRLEERVAERKYDVYKPVLDLFREVLAREREIDEAEMKQKITEFATWVAIYGSDEAVLAFRNFMQASYHGPPPPAVLMRLYSDFVLAARRDIGYPDTALNGADVLAIRISDIYETGMAAEQTMALEDLFEKYEWRAPWLVSPQTSQP